MHLLHILFLIVPILSNENKASNQTPISTEFIEKLIHYSYDENDPKELVSVLDSILSGEELSSFSLAPKSSLGYVDQTYVNLDRDDEKELIVFVGWSPYLPVALVFKKIEEQWYLLFWKEITIHYSLAKVEIIGEEQKDKIFCIRELESRGSGVYQDSNHFYKILNNKVVHCLQIMNEAQIYGWGLNLNQKSSSSYVFDKSGKDQFKVTYDYHFFPGPFVTNKKEWESNDSLILIKDKRSVVYHWNSDSLMYLLEEKQGEFELNTEKIQAMLELGHDE